VFPGHSKSDDREGELVAVRMLTYQQMHEKYGARYKAATGRDAGQIAAAITSQLALSASKFVEGMDGIAYAKTIGSADLWQAGAIPGAADVAGAVVGAAVDFVKAQLEQEAELYEAQFGARRAFDKFWTYCQSTDGKLIRVQTYAGFEVVRTTDATRKALADGKATDDAAFRFVCALVPSADQSAFLIKPLSLDLAASRAKVLSFELPYDFLSVLWTWLLDTGDRVDVKLELTMDALWIDKDQRQHIERVSQDTIDVGKITLGSSLDAVKLEAFEQGWIAAIPVSTAPRQAQPGRGTFWLGAKVTERDPSNAREYILKAAEELGERRDDLVKAAQGAGDRLR
jgi:hypothetical protein